MLLSWVGTEYFQKVIPKARSVYINCDLRIRFGERSSEWKCIVVGRTEVSPVINDHPVGVHALEFGVDPHGFKVR